MKIKIKTDYSKLISTILIAGLTLVACSDSSEKTDTSTPEQQETTQDISLIENETNDTASTDSNLEQPTTEDPLPQLQPSVEMMDNPEYKSWAKYGIGTKITLENTTESQGVAQNSTITYTLTSVNPDSLTYEMSIKTTFNGQNIDMSPHTQTVLAKIPAGTPTRPHEIPGVKIIEERQEVITVDDRSFKTRVIKFEMQGGEEPNVFTSTTTVWESEEVPGLTARMESTVTFNESTSKTTLALIEVEIK